MLASSQTIVGLFLARVAADTARVALLVPRGAQCAASTWGQIADDVRRLAVVLVEQGVAPGDRVLHISPNRREWVVADLAIQLARGVHVPVHNVLSGPQMAYQLADCGAKLVIVAGAEQAAKLHSRADQIAADTLFFSHDACSVSIGDRPVRALADLTAQVSTQVATELEQRLAPLAQPDDLATIIYTSGTTGDPKGVMLTQRNLYSNSISTLNAIACLPTDLRLCWLPLSHIFARTCDFYMWIGSGCQLALAQSPETILDDCRQLSPSLINGVPYFFEKVQRHLRDQGRQDEPGSLLQLLGGRMRYCCSGGAPLPDHVARFFNERGVSLTQGYGLTETSPVITLGTPEAMKIGTVGKALQDVELRIAADGEITTRGPHVMVGYWNKPDATREVLRDGWFHTGDLGDIDAEGYLRITGRKKELIVTAGGKNVAPVQLEALLVADPLIQQAIIIGDRQKYLTALIVPSAEALRAEIISRGIPVSTPAEALAHPDVRELYRTCITQRLACLSSVEQIGSFTLLDRGFSVELGELTPTLKLRRAVIQANFAAAIRDMHPS